MKPQTKRLYAWHEQTPIESRLLKSRTLHQLRARAKTIWRAVASEHDLVFPETPRIEFRSIATSWYETDQHLIAFAPRQRCDCILIHEMTHALGYWEHDARFARVNAELLVRFGRACPIYVAASLGAFGVQV